MNNKFAAHEALHLVFYEPNRKNNILFEETTGHPQ
jgi:hypothetical protein